MKIVLEIETENGRSVAHALEVVLASARGRALYADEAEKDLHVESWSRLLVPAEEFVKTVKKGLKSDWAKTRQERMKQMIEVIRAKHCVICHSPYKSEGEPACSECLKKAGL